MPTFEYKVVPAPTKGIKTKGARGTEARFAAALAEIMNEMGADGWEYQRSDTLPCESRSAMGKRSSQFLNMLVFRRAINTLKLEDEVPATPVLRRVKPAATVEKVSPKNTADEAVEKTAKSEDAADEEKPREAE